MSKAAAVRGAFLYSAFLRGTLLRGAFFAGALTILAACGAPVGTPTPLPPDVVRPQQPTPIYSTAQPRFMLEEVVATPIFPATIQPMPTTNNADEQLRAQILAAMLMNLPPSAMGVATGGATIFAEPGGAVVGSLPAGGSITVTGRSQDGNWLAVYTNDALVGWVPVGTLRLFGADDLEIVTSALSPAPVATMIADAMVPPALRMADVIATRAAAPPTPVATASPDPAASVTPSTSADGAILVGTVQTQGNLNLRNAPTANGAIVAPLASGSQFVAVSRTADGAWLKVRAPAGDGWVSAQFVALDGSAASLPAENPQ